MRINCSFACNTLNGNVQTCICFSQKYNESTCCWLITAIPWSRDSGWISYINWAYTHRQRLLATLHSWHWLNVKCSASTLFAPASLAGCWRYGSRSCSQPVLSDDCFFGRLSCSVLHALQGDWESHRGMLAVPPHTQLSCLNATVRTFSRCGDVWKVDIFKQKLNGFVIISWQLFKAQTYIYSSCLSKSKWFTDKSCSRYTTYSVLLNVLCVWRSSRMSVWVLLFHVVSGDGNERRKRQPMETSLLLFKLSGPSRSFFLSLSQIHNWHDKACAV